MACATTIPSRVLRQASEAAAHKENATKLEKERAVLRERVEVLRPARAELLDRVLEEGVAANKRASSSFERIRLRAPQRRADQHEARIRPVARRPTRGLALVELEMERADPSPSRRPPSGGHVCRPAASPRSEARAARSAAGRVRGARPRPAAAAGGPGRHAGTTRFLQY